MTSDTHSTSKATHSSQPSCASAIVASKSVAQKVASAIVGFWLFLALLFTPQIYLSNLRSPTPLSWTRAHLATVILFQVWSVLTPLLLWLGRRFPLERHRLLRNLGIHLLLSGPVALAHIFPLQIITTLLLTWSRSYQPPVPLTALVVGLGATNVMVYWNRSLIYQSAPA